jgi:hypothetical protein
MNAVDEALLACSRGEISNTAVVRAMAESQGWYVPMIFAAGKLGVRVADHAVILSTEFGGDPRVLSLFTDQDAVHRATGQNLGAFSGYLRGVDIFDALDEAEFDRVNVNPGSQRELTFYLESGAFGLCKLVAQVVRLEQALTTATDATIPFAMLRDHPGYMIAVNPANNAPCITEVNGFDGPCAIVFTSPDRYELYTRRLTEEQRAATKTVTLPGSSLFDQLQSFDVKGFVLNPFCPGTVVMPAFLFPRIVAGE